MLIGTKDYTEFNLNREIHRMKIGLPTRELWIDGEWYSLCFNEKPIGPFMSLPNNSNHQIYQSNSTKFTGTFYCTVQSRFSDIKFSDKL